jgi:hypothetical protein
MGSLRIFPLAATALVVLTTSACSGTPERRFIIGGGGSRSQEIRVEVVNDNFLDMGIFVMEGSTNWRLGDVTGKTTATFTLDLGQISPSGGLRLLADPVGSREAYLSDAVAIYPGVTVVFNVAPALSQSYVILR